MRLKVISLLTAYCLVLTVFVACGAPSKSTIQKLDNAAVIVVRETEANESLPDQLLAEKIINADQYAQAKKLMAEIKSGAVSVEHGLSIALTVEKPSLGTLSPVVADIIANLRLLNGLAASARIQQFLAAVEIGLRVLGSYFALQISDARSRGYSDRQIARSAGVEYVPEKFELLATAYDGARFDEYVAAL